LSWTSTIDETTDWSDLTFLNMFVDAINERYTACGAAAPLQAFVGVGTGKTVSSVSTSLSGGNTTVTVTVTAHGYASGGEVYVDGLEIVARTITAVTTNTFTYVHPGSFSAPAGPWTSYLLPSDAQSYLAISALQAAVKNLIGATVGSSIYVDASDPIGVIYTTLHAGFLHYEIEMHPLVWSTVASAVLAGSDFQRSGRRTVGRLLTRSCT